jgi:HAD superfamily hydrolase (TIGR01549 family)
MVKPKAILFDIGSTLWQSPPEHPDALSYCYGRGREILLRATPEVPSIEALIETVEGYLAEWEDIWRQEPGRVLQPPTSEYVATALEKLDLLPPLPILEAFTDVVMETSLYTAKHEPEELGMKEALAALKDRGLRLGAVSNAFMSAGILHQIMTERGLGQYLDLTVSSCDLGWRKPDPRIYQAAVDEIGATAPEVIFVGDRLDADVEGPAAIGMRTVLSHQYRQEDPATARVKPDFIIAHLSDLPGYLDSLFTQSEAPTTPQGS